VAFGSDASNLVPGDTNGFADIFVHDRQTTPALAAQGSCPGPMTVTATNCTPNAPVAFLYGNPGSYTNPNGICAGVTLGIASPTLAAVRNASGSGTVSVAYNFPAALCGRTVQIVDVATCTTSNTITL
jgi:hypothetical protein